MVSGRFATCLFFFQDGNYDIYTMNADGLGRSRLPPISQFWTRLSPNGSKIAFMSSRDGDENIYIMDSNGANQIRITPNTSNETHPVWSPDGLKIAFRSDRDGNYEIYTMNADGTGQTRLTNNLWRSDMYAAWSPDGLKMAFMSDRNGDQEIFTMNPDGSGQTRLTNHPARDQEPAWSIDGSRIAFISNRDGNDEIYMMGLRWHGSDPPYHQSVRLIFFLLMESSIRSLLPLPPTLRQGLPRWWFSSLMYLPEPVSLYGTGVSEMEPGTTGHQVPTRCTCMRRVHGIQLSR